MVIFLGVALLVVAGVMLWIGRPRNGEMSPLLRGRYVETTYSVALTGFIGMGLACIFGGFAGG